MEGLFASIAPQSVEGSGTQLQPPNRRRRREHERMSVVARDFAETDLNAERKLLAVHDAALRQIMGCLEYVWKLPTSSIVVQMATQALQGGQNAKPQKGQKHDKGAAHIAVAVGILRGLLTQYPDMENLSADPGQQKAFAEEFAQFKQRINALVTGQRSLLAMQGQVTKAVVKTTK